MRANTGLGILFLVGCAFGLYQVKYMVRDVKKDVASLTTQLKDEQKAMHVLDAEWAHLIRPERLEELAQVHLGLTPASVAQLEDDVAIIPVRAIVTPREDTPQLASAEAPAVAATPVRAPVGATSISAIPIGATPVNYAAR